MKLSIVPESVVPSGDWAQRPPTASHRARRLRSSRLELVAGASSTLALAACYSVARGSSPETPHWEAFAVWSATAVALMIWIARRLADIGRDNGVGFWMLLVPGLNLLFVAYLVLRPGMREANYYGAPAPSSPSRAVLLAGISAAALTTLVLLVLSG